MSRLQNPWPQGFSINPKSRFGWRIHPISRTRKWHHGVDVGGSFPVTVAADGKVMKVGWSPNGGGHTVLIDHGDIVTVYYHGAHRTALAIGQDVQAGEFVFQSGSTGASTGKHLHFEVRRGREMGGSGAWGDTLDPENFLPKPGERPQDGISQDGVQSGPMTPAMPSRPAGANVRPPFLPTPMSAGLKRFFDIQRALKGIK